MTERWRGVPGWPRYEVSDLGRIRRSAPGPGTYSGRILACAPMSSTGYPCFTPVNEEGDQGLVQVHQAVMKAFVGPPPEGRVVNHINGDKADNRLENLEYVTHQQNCRHAVDIGLVARGERVGTSRLAAEQVLAIRWYEHNTEASQRSIAERFGVSQGTVGFIVKRETWVHLPKVRGE